MYNLVSFAVGFIFAIGLGVAGMTQPEKIIAFLDIFGNWDPTLMFVMIGAISVHALVYYFSRDRRSPLLTPDWHVNQRRDITPQLLIGSAIFGVGWGLAGYCPGPALVAAGSGQSRALIFVMTMVAGIFFHKVLESHIDKFLNRRGR